MLGFIAFVLVHLTCTRVFAQEGEIIIPEDNKAQCINDMVQWCNNMQYPQQGVGMSVLSLTYEDPNAYYRVFCSSDSDGTNCTRNREPWFSCSPDHVLAYKGKILTNDSKDVDGDICRTADKAFNELFVQNMSFDNTTLKKEIQKGMEAFFEQMAAMEEQIALIHRILSKLLPADLWREFSDSFLFRVGPSSSSSSGDATDSTTVVPGTRDNNQSTAIEQPQSNQIETE